MSIKENQTVEQNEVAVESEAVVENEAVETAEQETPKIEVSIYLPEEDDRMKTLENAEGETREIEVVMYYENESNGRQFMIFKDLTENALAGARIEGEQLNPIVDEEDQDLLGAILENFFE